MMMTETIAALSRRADAMDDTHVRWGASMLTWLDAGVGEALLRAVENDPSLEITIDVERRTVTAPAAGIESTFPLDDFTQWRLLEGLDDIGLTLRHEDAVTAYETRRPAWMPSLG